MRAEPATAYAEQDWGEDGGVADSEPGWPVRGVALLKGSELVLCQFEVERCDRFGQMVGLRGSDNRRGHDRIGQHPGQRHLGHGDPARLGDLLYRIDHWLVQG